MHWAINSISKIKKLHLSHRNWSEALSYSHAMLIASSPGEVVCITGPSRAGKSRLIESLEELLICGDDFINSDYMPVVKILATNCSVGGTFSSKAFTLRALEAVKHPFYSDNNLDSKDWGATFYKQLGRTPETVLRPALEAAIINRKTKYIFIDEAQHVLYSRGGKKDAAAILESWKCLAQSTGVVLVLVGAYPLLDALALCPHMIGRKHQIHISRYRSIPEDLKVFLSLLSSYSKFVNLEPNVDSLTVYANYLYEGSLGCIGLLEAWIREALAYAMANDDSYLLLKHFEKSYKVDKDRRMVAAEIKNGEEFFLVNKDQCIVKPKKISSRKNRKPFEKIPFRHEISGRA
jgi:hypothetical protein